MPACKAATLIGKNHARCAKLTAECGFICSVPIKACQACAAAGGSAVDLKALPIAGMVRGYLAARLTAGDCPKYQAANPVDLNAAFGKFAALASKERQGALLAEMLRVQSSVAVADGGHEAATLAAKLDAIAVANDLEEALEEAAAGDVVSK